MNQKADQAKQALECCVKQSNCRDCPLYEEHTSMCLETACKNALDYIDRLESDVRHLTDYNLTLHDLWRTETSKVKMLISKLVDISKRYDSAKRFGDVIAEGIENYVSKKNGERSDTLMLDVLFNPFHGVMRITPRSMIVPAFELEAEWLYLPSKNVWIANGVEYSKDICRIVRITRRKL